MITNLGEKKIQQAEIIEMVYEDYGLFQLTSCLLQIHPLNFSIAILNRKSFSSFNRQQLESALSSEAAAASVQPSNGLIRPDLTLLKPLWLLLNKMDGAQSSDSAPRCLPAVHRALTELFLLAEKQAQVW